MAAPFGITTTATTIVLDEGLRAEAAFTVLNQTGVPVAVRVLLVPQPPLTGEWLKLEGLAERRFPTGGAEQYLVAVTVPPGTPESQLRFRLDAVAADQPDSAATPGPAVAFDVPYVPIEIPVEPPGYLRTWLGALIGALPGALLGSFAGFAIGSAIGSGITVEPASPSATPLPDLGAALGTAFAEGFALGIAYVFVVALMSFLGLVIGIWLGAAVGSWLALRLGSYVMPWRTAVPLAVIFPFSSLLILFLMILILGLNLPGFLAAIIVLLGLLGVVSAPALGGRAWYRWRTTGGL